ncbi:MAG: sporulation protein YhbH [Armatimonadetes bacterium]|nr:sporulation protein YhbH [Armatimonadota bacterium]
MPVHRSSITKHDWTLHRKGPMDQERHKKRIKEAVKENLADIVSEENIIFSDGKKIIKVPIKSLDEYKFRFDTDKQKGVGQGQGKSNVGDVIGQAGPGGGSDPGKAGTEPGVDYYIADLSLDELADMVFEDFELPRLEEKRLAEVETETVRFTDIRKTGILPNLDKKRTIRENIKRNAIMGEARFKDVQSKDLRFKTWDIDVRRESNAVILAMMDTSGSMGEFEKYIAKSFYFWMVKFLRTKYQNTEIVFIAHHTEAKVVTEEEFFTKGESGGTRASSAYRLALHLIDTKYNTQDWNIYPFHFSDGDNQYSDNDLCIQLVRDLIGKSNLFGYGEIKQSSWPYTSTLMSVYSGLIDEKFVGVVIEDKKDVYPALKRFFSRKGE